MVMFAVLQCHLSWQTHLTIVFLQCHFSWQAQRFAFTPDHGIRDVLCIPDL